jgi:hypothetical protein
MGYAEIKALYDKNCFTFETKPYRVNHFGRRNKDLITVNQFNDIRGIAFVDDFGNEICLEFKCTTKPGLTGLVGEPVNKNGTFIMAPGFYNDCWIIGKHNRGKEHEHDALVQRTTGVFKGWRDNNKNGKFDFDGKIYEDATGVNDHTTRAHQINNVGGFSLGCQVTQDDKEHMIKMAAAMRDFELYGLPISYALFQH